MNNPWISRYMENHKSQLRSYHDQANSYYRREEIAIGAQYAAEREQYRTASARELQYLKHSQDLDIQNVRHSQQLDIEEKRSSVAKWIEEFRQKTGLKIENKRQEGAQVLQEREHVHHRLIFELEQAESRARSDEDHARSLEVMKKTAELATFQRQREAVYALEAQRFAGIIAEREAYTAAIVNEFNTRNSTGQAVVSTISTLLVNKSNANVRLNEMVLAAGIRAAERKAARDAEAEAEAGKAVDRVVDGWKRRDDGNR